MYTVAFLNENNKVVELRFDSPYQCRLFVNKAKKSKRIKLLSYPSCVNQ